MDTPILIGFGSILLAAVADVVLTTRWNRAYYTFGVPIFIRRVHKPGGIGDLPLDDLEKALATAAGPPLLFRRLDNNVIAFREKVFGGVMHYIPIMHGVIRYDAAEGVARVTGIVNWFVIAFIACFAFLLGRSFFELLPIIAGVYGIIYFIQAVRFNRVAKKLQAQ
jgi:hypothetical protein